MILIGFIRKQANARKIFSACVFLLFFLLFLASTGLSLALELPSYQSYVNDYAGMVSSSVKNSLTRTLQDIDQSDSIHVAVLTIPTLSGESLESFSRQVSDKWQLGQKGVLLLVARDDRKIRIEVGSGLEFIFTAQVAAQIIDNVISPQFKAGNYDKGFETGGQAIARAVKGDLKPARITTTSGAINGTTQKGLPSYLPLTLAFIVIVMIGLVFVIMRSKKPKELLGKMSIHLTCESCGLMYTGNEKFCKKCGTKLIR